VGVGYWGGGCGALGAILVDAGVAGCAMGALGETIGSLSNGYLALAG